MKRLLYIIILFSFTAQAQPWKHYAKDYRHYGYLWPDSLRLKVVVPLLGSDATGDIYYRNSSGYLTRLAVASNGNVLTLSSGLPSWQAPSVAATGGNYTPTITSVTNVSATTAYQVQYTVIGNYVHIAGKVDIDPTATGTFLVGISLPPGLGSSFGSDFECSGTGCVGSVPDLHGIIRADVTNGRAELQCTIPTAASIANNSWYFEFLYTIIGG